MYKYNGSIYTLDDIKMILGVDVVTDAILAENGVTLVNQDFQEAAATEDAPAVAEIDETPELESQLENILSEYKKVEKNWLGDKYEGTRAGKIRLDQRYNTTRKALEKSYVGKEMDIEKPRSIINKGEGEALSFLSESYPGVYMEKTGVRNALNIYFPGQDKPTELDLNPFTLDGTDESVAVLKALDKAYKAQDEEALVENGMIGLVNLAEAKGNTSTLNTALEGTGYKIELNDDSGTLMADDGGILSGFGNMYDIYKDGQLVKDVNPAELRQFIANELPDETRGLIAKKAYTYTSTYLEDRAKEIDKESKVIQSDDSLNLKYFKNNFNEELITRLQAILPEGNKLTEEEIEQIKEYQGVDDGAEMVYNAKLDRMIKIPVSREQSLSAIKNLSGLPESVGLKILEAGGNEFIESIRTDGIKQLKAGELLDRSRTISQRLMAARDQDFLAFGQGLAGIEKNVFEDGMKKEVSGIAAINEEFQVTLDTELKDISGSLPEGSSIKVEYTPNGSSIFEILNDRKDLNAQEKEQLKKGRSRFFRLQQDYENLQIDRQASINDLQQKAVEFYANNPADEQVFNDSMKEYGLGALIRKDVNDSFAGVLLALPTLANADWAVEQQKRLNAKNEYYETMGTYSDGDFLTYALRSVSQQSGNITLAIATGGIGSAAGLSTAMTANAISAAFGISSGTQTYRDLKSTQQIKGTADRQAKVALQAYEDGIIDLDRYTRAMQDINTARAMYELDDDQIINAAVANGIIEGTFSRFLGTAPNTMKLLKDFRTPTTAFNISKNIKFGKFGPNKYEKIANLIGKPLLKRGGGEVLEEELIYGGQQFVTEFGILDRDLDLSAWDETAMSTVLTLGVSQSPGVAYSGLLTYNATVDFEKKINNLRLNKNDLSKLIQDVNISPAQKKLLINDMAANLKEQGLEVDKLGVDILGRDVDDMKRLIGTEMLKNQVLFEAGVLPGMSDVDKAEVIKAHKESLNKQEAELFDTQISVLDKQIKDIKNKPTSTKKAKESLGSLWTNNDKYLSKTNKDGYNEKTTEEKLVAVINQVRESVGRASKKSAKANPEVVEMVESETIDGKPLNKQQKEVRYRELGDQMALNRSRAISVASGVSTRAETIFADLDNVNYAVYTTEDELREVLEANGVETNTPEFTEAVEKFNNNGTYGAVIGNTIVTQDAAQAKKDIDNGVIQAGTVIFHEFSHIADDASIKPENRKMYAENLAAAAAKSKNRTIQSIDAGVRRILDNLYNKNEDGESVDDKDKLTFENSEKYRDEYTKVMQESLYAYEDEVKIEKEDNLMTRIFNNTDPNNLNTPEKALEYLAANNAAFRAGKISKKTKKAIKNFKGKDVKFSDKTTVNKLALDFKKDPEAFMAGKDYGDLFMQFQSVALDAMGYDVSKGDIAAADAMGYVATEFESVMKNYKPVKDGQKIAFTTYVNAVFQRGRANKFFKQELGSKEGRVTITDAGENRLVSTDTAESGIDLAEREAREKKSETKRINPLSAREVDKNKKAINDAVVVTKANAPIADFKSISRDYGGKVAGIIFNVPEAKINDGAKNLTYAKKIVDGIPEPSEAGNIQRLYSDTQVLARDIKLLPDTNVTSEESRVGEKGEKVTVTRDVQGRSLGLPNRIIKFFYEDTGKRSKGTTSQTKVYKKKAKFINPTPQVLKEIQREMGITPARELNQYNRTIGQFLKGFAKVKGSVVAVAVAKNKVAALDLNTAKGKKQIEADIGAGRSKLQLSEKTKQIFANPLFKLETKGIDGLLKSYGIDGTFKLKTREDVDAYIADIKKNLLPLMPKEFWFGKTGGTQFTPSSKVLGKNEKALYKEYFRPEMKKLALDENQKYGDPILVDGKPVDFKKPSYDSLFKTKEIIQAKIKSGAIKDFNKKVGKIHQEMWYRFNDAIRRDKNNAKVIGNYLKMTGSDTSHWHKMGAQFVGYSNKITGDRFEYEHAMPATAAYLYLLDVSLSKTAFERAYDFVIDNYKLISLDKAMDKKLTAVGLRSSMPEGWNLLDNKWYDRYFSELVATQDGGIDPTGLIGLDGKNFQEIYGVNNYGNTYVKGFKSDAKSEITKDNTADKAMANARNSIPYSEKPKKARVFDFDDTLAQSNSMVIVNKPNPEGGFSEGTTKLKAIFMVGGPGAGKTNVGKGLQLGRRGYKVVNQDIALEAMKSEAGLPGDESGYTAEQRSTRSKLGFAARKAAVAKFDKYAAAGNGMVIDGTGASYNATTKKIKELQDKGFEVHMVVANTPLETALERNKARKERSLPDSVVRKTYDQVQESLAKYKQDFAGRLYEINTENIQYGKPLPKDFLDQVYAGINSTKVERINATEFALEAGNLEQQGATFNFSEFSQVIDGKKGPLFDVAKFISEAQGQRDMFVLTARPPNSAPAIKEFLSSLGLNIPIENIIGLADGKAQAKADWFIKKYSEGYNDFYFADDALKNVKAVKAAFDVLDVKSQVQQARVKFSEKMSTEFNDMIERNKGVKSQATFSDVQARRRGTKQKKYTFFIPPSADDFRGLTMYTFAGKGKQGEADQEFFDKALIKPYQAGVAAINRAKFRIRTDYGALVKNNKKIAKRLKNEVAGTNHTLDEAIRVYLWNKEGYDIPGMSKRDVDALVGHVESGKNGELIAYAEGVKLVTRKDAFPPPTEFWDGSTILGDLNGIATDTNRAEFLKEFIDNSKVIFSPENLNKVEAIYGFRVRESIENILFRMETGQNKAKGSGRIVNGWNDWVNNSVGAIMFFNRRSALMQTLSTVNFVNWSDNNPIKAAAAFANQPQYWKDFITLWSSPKLVARRSGLESDIQEAEIARAAKKGGAKGVISYLLKIGFTPTQLADSFAIASGGATFYRNRVNSYLKETNDQGEKVYTKEQAEQKAFEDFSSIAEETQQSGDPMLVSQQQASVLGRLVLAFQNTPMQYTRLIKKSGQDLINRRGNPMTHISKIVYYGFVQNLIFSTLQNALFALIPGFDDEEEDFKTDKEKEKYLEKQQRKEDGKVVRVANSMVDTLLRGSGLAGAVVSTIKNVIMAYQKYDEAPMIQKENADIILAALNISPPIGSKARKINNVLQTMQFEKDVLAERGFSVMIDGHFQLSPAYDMLGDLTSATLNLPLDRVADEVNAITEALDTRNTQWQRIALALGWRQWDVGARAEEHDLIKTEAKAKRKVEGKEKAKATREKNKQLRKEYIKLKVNVFYKLPDSVQSQIKKNEKSTGYDIPSFKLKELAKQYNIDIDE